MVFNSRGRYLSKLFSSHLSSRPMKKYQPILLFFSLLSLAVVLGAALHFFSSRAYADDPCEDEDLVKLADGLVKILNAAGIGDPSQGKFEVKNVKQGEKERQEVTFVLKGKAVAKSVIPSVLEGEIGGGATPLKLRGYSGLILSYGYRDVGCSLVIFPRGKTSKWLSLGFGSHQSWVEDLDEDGQDEIISNGRVGDCGSNAEALYWPTIFHVDISSEQVIDVSRHFPFFYARKAKDYKEYAEQYKKVFSETRYLEVCQADLKPLIEMAERLAAGRSLKKSLTFKEIENLLKEGVSQSRVAMLIGEHGVAFELTEEMKQRLSSGEVEGGVLEALHSETKKGMPKGTDDAEMAVILAGEFMMGNDDGEANEKPAHKVYLDSFHIDKYEVTNNQYGKFMAAAGYGAPGYWNHKKFNAPKQPVVGVSWHQADAYCMWAGKRLPTEAEWEKAARGTDGRKYPWGNEEPDKSRANYLQTGPRQTTPLGSYPSGASPYGIHDMAGNVWEWVADSYDEGFYKNSPAKNPKPSSSTSGYHVLRGGSWYSPPKALRASGRYRGKGGSSNVGFRCAKDASS